MHACALSALLMLRAAACVADDPSPAHADTTLIGDQARAAKKTVKQNARRVTDAAREGVQQAATTARQVARDVASSAAEGAQQVVAATRKGARKVKTTVSRDKTAPPAEPDKPIMP